MTEILFLDLDDTILDFHKAERLAVAKTFREFGLEPTDAVLTRYHEINKQHWQRLETGEITRDQVLTGRFQVLFKELGHAVDPESVARSYERNLGIGHYYLPGAREALEELRGKYRLFLASNGTASVQHSRLESAGLYPVFERVFVSQELGFNKPAREFFDACAAQIPGYDPAKAMMVGDSLSSDIRGGKNAGIQTCWVNPEHKAAQANLAPDYEIESLSQLPALLRRLEGKERAQA